MGKLFPIMKINIYGGNISYQSLAPFQYRIMHSLVILNVFHQNFRFHCHFCKISRRCGCSLCMEYFNFFFTPEWDLMKCIYEILRQICMWALVLRWPLSPVDLLFINTNYVRLKGSENNVQFIFIPLAGESFFGNAATLLTL